MNTKEEGKEYPKDHPYMIRLDEVLWVTPTNSSQSDTLQVKSPHIVIQTNWCYILGSPNTPNNLVRMDKERRILFIIIFYIILLEIYYLLQ